MATGIAGAECAGVAFMIVVCALADAVGGSVGILSRVGALSLFWAALFAGVITIEWGLDAASSEIARGFVKGMTLAGGGVVEP